MLIWTAIAACIEQQLSPDDVHVEPPDTGPPSPDSPAPTDTANTNAPDACDGESWQPTSTTVSKDCVADPGFADWNLREVGIVEGVADNGDLCFGRFTDGDGDGDVDQDDPWQYWASHWSGARLSTLDGQELASWQTNGDYGYGTTAKLSSSGGESAYFAAYARNDSGYQVYVQEVGLLAGDDLSWNVVVTTQRDEIYLSSAWATDLTGDGTVELLAGPLIYSESGELVASLEGLALPAIFTRTMDLDLDGVQEIVAIDANNPPELRLHEADGSYTSTCTTGSSHDTGSQQTRVAIGNLDEDSEGEVVWARDGLLSVCDTDFSLLAEITAPSDWNTVMGIGDLDGDGAAEILVADLRTLRVYDRDLNELWTWEPEIVTGYDTPSFTLADLDNDADLEVIAHFWEELVVFDGDGTRLAELRTTDNTWSSVPVYVFDIDCDGLAEIVSRGSDGVVAVVVENDAGGWLVDGDELPVSGVDRYPNDRSLDGTPTSPYVPWSEPGNNVWQGLGTDGIPQMADLAVEIVDVCADDCASDAAVTVYVSNSGQDVVHCPVDVAISTLRDPVELARATVSAPIEPGASVPVTLSVPAALLPWGLVATVDPEDAWAECDLNDNVDTWDAGWCEHS